MRCKLCKDFFYFKRDLLTLFNEKEEYLCPRCYSRYPIKLNIYPIQLERYQCVIISIFDKKYFIDYNFFIKEYTKIFNANYKRKNFITLFFNEVTLDEYGIEALDAMSKMLCSNLIVICFLANE